MVYKQVAIGDVYGRLTVIERIPGTKKVQPKWRCVCECGNETTVYDILLKKGRTKSCGCFRKENSKQIHTTHGMTNSRAYKTWTAMKQRCNDSTLKTYSYYGGRGISYDAKWESFDGFWEDMQEGYSDDLTIDRIDVNKGYCKENCRWANHHEQSMNKTNTAYLEMFGERKTLLDWCDQYGMSYVTYWKRLKRWKCTPEVALTTPLKDNGYKKK